MKHFWLGVGILAALLALGLWTQTGMDRVHLETAHSLQQASEESLQGDPSRGRALANAARERWQAHWEQTAALVDHRLMDEIDGLFSQLQVYSRTDQTGRFAALCAQLASLLEVVAEENRLTWWNLL